MAIEIKDLIEQAVDIASERRQSALSKQEAEKVKGGATKPVGLRVLLPIHCPNIIGLYLPPDNSI
jgi:hypothetical protein